MADKIVIKNGLPIRMKDVGDGTYREVVSTEINGSLANNKSNVLTDVTIAAGATTVVGTYDTPGRRCTFAATVGTGTTFHNFKVGYRYVEEAGVISLGSNNLSSTGVGSLGEMANFDVKSPKAAFTINNTDTVDHKYNIHVYNYPN